MSYGRGDGHDPVDLFFLREVGRVEQDRVQLTNSGWSFSARALSESQRFEHLHVINDFEAVGHAVGALRTGIFSLIGVAPIALGLLLYAYRAVPGAEATIAERAAGA